MLSAAFGLGPGQDQNSDTRAYKPHIHMYVYTHLQYSAQEPVICPCQHLCVISLDITPYTFWIPCRLGVAFGMHAWKVRGL